ncbi:MAG TPA: hypothetical protein PKH07_14325 [bacterium]|nr:hypothetical protein [bacterium]
MRVSTLTSIVIGVPFLLVILVGIALLIIICINSWESRQTYHDATLMHKPGMESFFSNRKMDEFLPADIPYETIYWFDAETDRRFSGLTPVTRLFGLYGVRINPKYGDLKVNGVEVPGAIGFIACPGIDQQANYYEEHNSVIEFRTSNGRRSGGDIIFIFHQ